jgi:hypothetical protein
MAAQAAHIAPGAMNGAPRREARQYLGGITTFAMQRGCKRTESRKAGPRIHPRRREHIVGAFDPACQRHNRRSRHPDIPLIPFSSFRTNRIGRAGKLRRSRIGHPYVYISSCFHF